MLVQADFYNASSPTVLEDIVHIYFTVCCSLWKYNKPCSFRGLYFLILEQLVPYRLQQKTRDRSNSVDGIVET